MVVVSATGLETRNGDTALLYSRINGDDRRAKRRQVFKRRVVMQFFMFPESYVYVIYGDVVWLRLRTAIREIKKLMVTVALLYK